MDPCSGHRHAHRNLRIGYFSQHHVDQLDLTLNSVQLLASRFPGESCGSLCINCCLCTIHTRPSSWKSGMGDSGLPTCTDFRGTYRFWPSITISRFHAGVYRFWKMREFLGLVDFVLFCFRRYSRILPASCPYRQSRLCVAAINNSPYAMNHCYSASRACCL